MIEHMLSLQSGELVSIFLYNSDSGCSEPQILYFLLAHSTTADDPEGEKKEPW